MALSLCLKADGTSPVNTDNPIQTKHSSLGEEKETFAFIVNDGKRKNVPGDDGTTPLIYTNLQIKVEGVSHNLTVGIDNNVNTNTLQFDSTVGWNIGTIIKHNGERMRIDSISGNTVWVTRNYNADGVPSSIKSHAVLDSFTAETHGIKLALPNPEVTDYSQAWTYVDPSPTTGAIPLVGLGIGGRYPGLDPSLLTVSCDTTVDSNGMSIIKSNNALKYAIDSIIQIENEQMLVKGVTATDIQVVRGYNGTTIAPHTGGATAAVAKIIYLVGIVDKTPITHKIFIKNDPPDGLPTQKKQDVKIVVIADEEPR